MTAFRKCMFHVPRIVKNSLVAKVGKTFQKSVEVKPRMDSRPAGKRTPTWWHNGNDIVFSPNSSRRKSLQAGRIVFFSTNGTLQGKKSLICQLLKWRFSHKNASRHHTYTSRPSFTSMMTDSLLSQAAIELSPKPSHSTSVPYISPSR